MRRATTALVALVSVLALGAAAGGFDTGSAPDLESDWEPTAVTTTGTPTGIPPPLPFVNKSAPPTPTGEEGGAYVASEPPATVADSGTGGVSPLFVAVFVGALLASAGLALVLTGDDDRAPPPESGPGDDPDPRPAVDVSYSTPGDSAVVRAWTRLATAAESGPTDTPDETARRATEAGFPRDAVDRVTEHFSAVRYGGEPADEARRERDARDAIEAFDRAADGDDA